MESKLFSALAKRLDNPNNRPVICEISWTCCLYLAASDAKANLSTLASTVTPNLSFRVSSSDTANCSALRTLNLLSKRATSSSWKIK